jgi:hypothetical protein
VVDLEFVDQVVKLVVFWSGFPNLLLYVNHAKFLQRRKEQICVFLRLRRFIVCQKQTSIIKSLMHHKVSPAHGSTHPANQICTRKCFCELDDLGAHIFVEDLQPLRFEV